MDTKAQWNNKLWFALMLLQTAWILITAFFHSYKMPEVALVLALIFDFLAIIGVYFWFKRERFGFYFALRSYSLISGFFSLLAIKVIESQNVWDIGSMSPPIAMLLIIFMTAGVYAFAALKGKALKNI